MTIAEAAASFLHYISQNEPSAQSRAPARERALSLLTDYFLPATKLSEITSTSLRDFIARWYVDTICAAKTADSDRLPKPHELLNTLAEFFTWADREAHDIQSASCLPILSELSATLPRALKIAGALSNWLRERGGAFSFPEFLTSFEEGGRSQYDIDVPDDVGAMEGYFRITRVEGSLAAAEELISGRQLWPIVFPEHIAVLLDAGFIINLEIVRKGEGWQMTGCGFAYPPGTDV